MNTENTKLLTLLDTLSGALTELKQVMTSPVTDSDMTKMREHLTLLREEVFALRDANTKLTDRVVMLETQQGVGAAVEAALRKLLSDHVFYDDVLQGHVESTIENKLNDDLENAVTSAVENMDLSDVVSDAFDQNVDIEDKVKDVLDSMNMSEYVEEAVKEKVKEVMKEATVTIEID